MSTQPLQSEIIDKEQNPSYSESSPLKAKSIDGSRPDRTELLQTILSDHGIWNIEDKKFNSQSNKKLFKELFFGFYISWITKNFNFPYQGNICYIALDDSNFLVVIPPINRTTAYVNSFKNGTELYKPTLFSGINLTNTKVCPICTIANFVKFNISQIPCRTDLNNKISDMNFDHSNCINMNVEDINGQLVDKIIENPELGVLTGGFGITIKCPSLLVKDICDKYFAEFENERQLSQIFDDLFVAFILIYLMDRCHLGVIGTNQSLRIEKNKGAQGFTNEIDGIGYSKLSTNHRVVGIELTSLFDTAYHDDLIDVQEKQLPKHFKQKVKVFNDMEYILGSQEIKLNYFYIHLRDFNETILRSIEYSAIKNNNMFTRICFEKDFTDLKEIIKAQEFTNGRLYSKFKLSFTNFINTLDKIR